ncbi:hypothetical protein [Novosphingobium sp. KA1]|uniref:hypothetical protein n=1 Tax=Novosphingobium sp. (strain KA1) TaxID=164608 RepID=UPI001A8CF8FE|nr:hypothetical protein [Novosphingobium sp. KA1]QSR19730.1 hypothetical protein CA833_21540 [Novosphingobium sp. KA1]
MSFAAPLSDVLSGASLVMAVLAAVFALWQPEINKALDAVVKPDKLNRAPEKKLVSQMKWGRLLPLLAVTILAAILLAPRSLSIIAHTAMCWSCHAPKAQCQFDEAGGLLLLTEVLLVVLAAAMWMQLQALNDKRDQLEK